MSNELLKHLAGKINEEIEHLSADLARGTAKDHGEYKYACGIIRGLMMANSLFAETATQMDEDDD